MITANRTLLQTFEWHTRTNPPHYIRLNELLPKLANLGITSIWLPPGCKANNPDGNGYDIYDLWDLGEFDQKGARRTKWGSKEELDRLLRTAKDHGIDVVWDAVINHKQAGDRTESGVWAVEVDKEDRRYEICPPKQIEAWLRYDFPGREREGMNYSSMRWRAEHFNGTDWDQSREKNAVYKLIDDPSTQPPFKQPRRSEPPRSRLASLRRMFTSQSALSAPPRIRPGKGWMEDVDHEHGNNDYLLFSNIDYTHPEVQEDVSNWGRWMIEEVGVQGFRLDAAQHFSFNFTRDWIQNVNAASKRSNGRDVLIIGEVWSGEPSRITKWLDAVQSSDRPQVYAYDSVLVYNFARISKDFVAKSRNLDLRTILRGSLLHLSPEAAVTLVANHDTQAGQASPAPIDPKLKALFYAFILLRQEGYPCVFWGDLFGTNGPLAEPPACLVPDKNAKSEKRSLLVDLVQCRRLFAYGAQTDYFNSSVVLAWTRAGLEESSGCVVLLSVEAEATGQSLKTGKPGELWRDIVPSVENVVRINADGVGVFTCNEFGVSVFVRNDQELPRQIDLGIDTTIH